ncbi:MAG TPA: hypothetical protein VJN62_13575 [Gemmatimonadales bacterium]|nr:hypothetical protein [Gemmatimonadales bacterium]
MRPMHRSAVALLLVCAGAGTLQGQASDALYTRWAGYTGFQFQSYSFSTPSGAKSSEFAIPVVLVAPLGSSMSVDLTAHYASAKTNGGGGGSDQTLSGLTDTQLRLLYTLNRDRLVASLSVNLPTGQRALTTNQFTVYEAVGSNYLSFPVSDFGTAFGATGGLAFATPAGAWNVGVSGAVRYTGSYTLLSDPSGSTNYKPGVEFRGRVGADRLVGQSSRFLAGLTASTFSNEQLSGSGGPRTGQLAPGLRIIGDAGWTSAMGSNTLSIAVWDYYRAKGTFQQDTLTIRTNSENVLNAEARFAIPASPQVSIQPVVGVRTWSPGQKGGTYVTGGLAARFGLSDQFTAAVEGRYTTGKALEQLAGQIVNFTGASVQLTLRYQH